MRRRRPPVPLMLAELMFSSWEAMARRTLMMAQGNCSPGEYRRMVREKAQAAYLSSLALVGSRKATVAAALAPWHRRAKANAKRLRRK